MGLSWQQGPLAPAARGRFLTAQPLPDRLLFAERLRRRMRVQFAAETVADSEDVLLLHEPGRYPVAYFPRADVAPVLVASVERTVHPELGATAWFALAVGADRVERAAWEHVQPPDHAEEFLGRVAFRWRAMDAFYEEDERILGHAADPYHRVDIRATSRKLVVAVGDRVVAETARPLVLYETGFTPRWYVPREDLDAGALQATGDHTFCPYKGVADRYAVAEILGAAWSYPDPYAEAARIRDHVCFDPEHVTVRIDGVELAAEDGQRVVPRGDDRGLTPDEVRPVRAT